MRPSTPMKRPTSDELPMARIAALWNWLPAFRAVAETEHLRRAARYLALSPPALSRTLRLLEDAVGYPLFHREARRLRLTERGRALLIVLRRSMRAIDDAIERQPVGLRIATLPSVAPLLGALWTHHPDGLLIRTHPLGMSVASAILQGTIDLAIVPEATVVPHKDLEITVIGSLKWGIFAPQGFEASALGDNTSTPIPSVSLAGWDGWPIEQPRTVVMETDDLATATAAAGNGLAVALPERLGAAGLIMRGSAWKVPFVTVRRPTLTGAPRDRHSDATRPPTVADPAAAAFEALRRAFAPED